jgi:phosphate transport system substrate-binding protein
MKLASSQGKYASISAIAKCLDRQVDRYKELLSICNNRSHLPRIRETKHKHSHSKADLARIPFLSALLSLGLASCTAIPSSQSPQVSVPSSVHVLRVSGSGTALPVVQKLAEAYTQKHPSSKFQFEPGTNSAGAIRGVVTDNLDLAVVNRPLSKAEAKADLDYHPFARDATAFVAHKPVPVQELSSAQIQDIYAGKLTNWQQVGGQPAPIIVLDRDPDESARKLFLLPFMQGRPVRAKTVVLSKSKDMVESLDSTPQALGYSSIGLLQIMQARQVQIVSLDGKIPSAEAVDRGTYPWYLTFGLVHHRHPAPALRDFVDFTISPEGRQVIEKYGYTGVKSKAAP